MINELELLVVRVNKEEVGEAVSRLRGLMNEQKGMLATLQAGVLKVIPRTEQHGWEAILKHEGETGPGWTRGVFYNFVELVDSLKGSKSLKDTIIGVLDVVQSDESLINGRYSRLSKDGQQVSLRERQLDDPWVAIYVGDGINGADQRGYIYCKLSGLKERLQSVDFSGGSWEKIVSNFVGDDELQQKRLLFLEENEPPIIAIGRQFTGISEAMNEGGWLFREEPEIDLKILISHDQRGVTDLSFAFSHAAFHGMKMMGFLSSLMKIFDRRQVSGQAVLKVGERRGSIAVNEIYSLKPRRLGPELSQGLGSSPVKNIAVDLNMGGVIAGMRLPPSLLFEARKVLKATKTNIKPFFMLLLAAMEEWGVSPMFPVDSRDPLNIEMGVGGVVSLEAVRALLDNEKTGGFVGSIEEHFSLYEEELRAAKRGQGSATLLARVSGSYRDKLSAISAKLTPRLAAGIVLPGGVQVSNLGANKLSELGSWMFVTATSRDVYWALGMLGDTLSLIWRLDEFGLGEFFSILLHYNPSFNIGEFEVLNDLSEFNKRLSESGVDVGKRRRLAEVIGNDLQLIYRSGKWQSMKDNGGLMSVRNRLEEFVQLKLESVVYSWLLLIYNYSQLKGVTDLESIQQEFRFSGDRLGYEEWLNKLTQI